jgi:choice-of-anchor A domain-containing protein
MIVLRLVFFTGGVIAMTTAILRPSALYKAMIPTALLQSLGRTLVYRVTEFVRNRGPFREGIMGCLLVLAVLTQANAGTLSLGTAAQYNVYVSGNMSQTNGDSWGSLAVGGNATLTSFTAASVVTSTGLSDSLTVGGALTFTNGAVNTLNNPNDAGNARSAGALNFSSASVNNGGFLYYGSTESTSNTGTVPVYAVNAGIPTNLFSNANSALSSATSILASQTSNGTTNLAGTTLTLSSSATGTEYFSVTSAQLATATTLDINAAAGATVVVNVTGTSVQPNSSLAFSYSGTTDDKTLFNFYQATSLTLSGVNFDASILAPSASLLGTNGHTDGNVMVGSISGNTSGFEYHNNAMFDGNLVVAEPPAIILTALGAVGAALLARRSRKSKPPVIPAIQ